MPLPIYRRSGFFIFVHIDPLDLLSQITKHKIMMKYTLILVALLCTYCVLPGQAVLTAVYDADLPGGLPKGVELYLLDDIADMSRLGIGSANNGGGTDGVEFTFPVMAADSGTYVYLSSDSMRFAEFFGFNADFVTGAMAINGDDAIELFWDSVVIDVFGEIDMSGAGQPWEYTDSWAARKPLTGPDGSAFVLQNWNFGGVGALDGEATNGSAQNPVPLESYTDTMSGGPDVTVIMQNLEFIPADITIEIGQTVRWVNDEAEEHNVNGLQTEFPCNPAGFFSGTAVGGPWTFDHTFNLAGVYDYQCDPHVSFDMVGTVTVVDPDAPDYPEYTIGDVHTEDPDGNADSVDVLCTLQGVVHGPNFRPNGLQFTIIDVANQTGINVFKGGSDCYTVTEGDLVFVRGAIEQFNGLTEIVPEAQIEVLSSGNALMVPVEVSTPLTEDMESTMAAVNGLTVDSIVMTGGSGWNLFGTNAAQVSYLVRLDADVIPDADGYAGQVIDVVGIVGQFDSDEPYTDGYQLQPRSVNDISVQVSTQQLPHSAIVLAPNPVTTVLRLNTDETVKEIAIYSTSGQLTLLKKGLRQTLDVSGLIAGEYLIVIETENGVWSSPFIKL